jgi:hypothetical protein
MQRRGTVRRWAHFAPWIENAATMQIEGSINSRERPTALVPQRVRGSGVHVRRQVLPADDEDEAFDESLFFLLALLAGAVSGYLVAIG